MFFFAINQIQGIKITNEINQCFIGYGFILLVNVFFKILWFRKLQGDDVSAVTVF